MRWFGGWRDERAARKHHQRMHTYHRPGYGTTQNTEPGCPFCAANEQWWVDRRAGQDEDLRKHRAKLREQAAAYERTTK